MTQLSERTPTLGNRELLGDQVLLIAIALSALGAIVLGFQFVEATTAFIGVALLVGVAAVCGRRRSLGSPSTAIAGWLRRVSPCGQRRGLPSRGQKLADVREQ